MFPFDLTAGVCQLIAGCGPVHTPFAYHVGNQRGGNALPQTAEQTANKGCTHVCIKTNTKKPGAMTIGSPQSPTQW